MSVRRYKYDITAKQKKALKSLLHHQTHLLITPEIRRELFAAAPKDAKGVKHRAAAADNDVIMQ